MVTTLALALLLVQSGGWEPLDPPPAEPGPGAAMAAYEGCFYAMRGGGTSEFWASPGGQYWIPLADVPVPVSSGGALASGTTPYLYALAGSKLWRYSIDADAWADLGPTPAPVAAGASIARVWNHLYALRGDRTTDFWRYDIESQCWRVEPPAPATVGYGGSMAHLDGTLYVVRGNGSDDRFRYPIVEGAWAVDPPLPDPVSSGGAIAVHEMSLVVLRGASSTTSWRAWPGSRAEPWVEMPAPASSGTAMVDSEGSIHVLFGQQQAFYRYAPPSPAPTLPPAPDERSDPDGDCAATAGGTAGGVPLMAALAFLPYLRRRAS